MKLCAFWKKYLQCECVWCRPAPEGQTPSIRCFRKTFVFISLFKQYEESIAKEPITYLNKDAAGNYKMSCELPCIKNRATELKVVSHIKDQTEIPLYHMGFAIMQSMALRKINSLKKESGSGHDESFPKRQHGIDIPQQVPHLIHQDFHLVVLLTYLLQMDHKIYDCY